MRLIVEMTRLPPGLVSATSEAQNSGTLLTCSITSEATTATKTAPANQSLGISAQSVSRAMA